MASHPVSPHPDPEADRIRWRRAADLAAEAARLPDGEVPEFLDAADVDVRLRADIEALLAGQSAAVAQPRRRAVTVAVALAVLSAVAGLVAYALEARRADRAEAEADRAREETGQLVDFLVGVFESSDPEASPPSSLSAREILDNASEKAREELDVQPLSRARLLDTMGVVYGQLGLPQESAPLLQEALVLRRAEGDDLAVAESLLNLGSARLEEGETDVAQRHLEEALELRRGELGPRHPAVAEVLDELGQLHEAKAEFIRAEERLRQALDIRVDRFGADSEPALETFHNLGLVVNNRGDYAAAQSIFESLLASYERLHGPDHATVARVLNALGIALFRQDSPVEAEGHFRRALEIREKLYGDTHRLVAQSLTNLANTLLDQGRRTEGLDKMERSIEVLARVYGGDTHNSVVIAVHNLGDFYYEEGDLRRAETLLRRALAASTELNGRIHPIPAFPAQRLGDVTRDTGRLDEAEALYRRAFETRVATLPAGHHHTAMSARSLADLLRRQGKEEEADRLDEAYPPEAEETSPDE